MTLTISTPTLFSADIALEAAGNHSTPMMMLIALASNENEAVRARVAENLHTPSRTLTRLSEDSSPTVRAAVAGNPVTADEVVDELKHDVDTSVREGALIAAESRKPEWHNI